MRKSRGFTLIETVVVAVIVAVLAAVAIPVYLGYVTSSNQDVVNNLAQTAAASANAYYRKTGVALTQADLDANKLNLFYDSTKHSITVSGSNITVSLIGSSPLITNTTPYK